MRTLLAFAIALVALLVVGDARAHMMPAKQGTLNVDGAHAYLVLALPISAFPGFDEDHDGRVDARELEAHADTVLPSRHLVVLEHFGDACGGEVKAAVRARRSSCRG